MPTYLANYYYENGVYTPKIIKEAAPYVLKGEFIDKLYTSKVTAEYPYYYIANKLHINFKGNLEELPTLPRAFNGFVSTSLDIIIKDANNFPKPLDIIKVGNKSFKLANDFTFNYNFATKELAIERFCEM